MRKKVSNDVSKDSRIKAIEKKGGLTVPLIISLVGGNSGISTEVAAKTYLSGYEKK